MKSAPSSTEQRLITTVAWLYHARGLRQSQIGERLSLSQSRVSRLLDQAVELAIVQTIVVLPEGEQSVVEEELESAYGLKEAHPDRPGDLLRARGQRRLLRRPGHG